MPDSATEILLQALAPLPNSSRSRGRPPANYRRPFAGPLRSPLQTGATHGGHFIHSTPPAPLPVWVWKTADPTSALFYWGRFFALAALPVVFCWLHTMPARHGAPRVHSNNASLGAGRACSRLGHCGSLRARGACFASEPGFPKSLHHSVVGRRDGDLGVPIGFQHFPGPCFWGGSKDPGF